MCTARYSCVQLSELEQFRMNEIARVLKQQQEDSNLRSLGWHSDATTKISIHKVARLFNTADK